jgi:class 3 adenylate cyclase/pimeloyl-ACP methyl ester carboxylesterase
MATSSCTDQQQDLDVVREKLKSIQNNQEWRVVMFVDMVGFSEHANIPSESPGSDSPPQAIERALLHNEIAKELAEGQGGKFVKSLGDGVFLSFESSTTSGHAEAICKAICTAINICITLNLSITRPTKNARPIRTKIGISSGTVNLVPETAAASEQGRNDLYGDAVNQSARLAGIARSNQILIDKETIHKLDVIQNSTQHIAIRINEETYTLYQHDRVHLKNMGERTVYEVAWDDNKSQGSVGNHSFSERGIPAKGVPVFEGSEFRYIDNEKGSSKGIVFLLSGLGLDHYDFEKFMEKSLRRCIAFSLIGFSEGSLPKNALHRYANSTLENHVDAVCQFIRNCLDNIQKERSDTPINKEDVAFVGFSIGSTIALLAGGQGLTDRVGKYVLLDPNTNGYGFISSQFASLNDEYAEDANYIAVQLRLDGIDGLYKHPDEPISNWKGRNAIATYFVKVVEKFAILGSFLPVIHMSRIILGRFSTSNVADYRQRNQKASEYEFEKLFFPAINLLLNNVNDHSIYIAWNGDADGFRKATLADDFIRNRVTLGTSKVEMLYEQGIDHFDLLEYDILESALSKLMKSE